MPTMLAAIADLEGWLQGLTKRLKAIALRKIMMATNKVSRTEEAFADTRVYQKRWKMERDRSSSDC
ncbi:hypothetical protein [Nostoc sp.]|uniref:hypothetical protein n=1 Tax=Nostoc sp. TaxID=1180 RepID=UPI002FF51015